MTGEVLRACRPSADASFVSAAAAASSTPVVGGNVTLVSILVPSGVLTMSITSITAPSPRS